MKKVFFSLVIIFSGFTALCQNVNIKDRVVLVDDKECLKITGTMNDVSFHDLEGNEIIFMSFILNPGEKDVHLKVTFLDQKISFTSRTNVFTKKQLIKKLIADGTLKDCKLDPEKVQRFVAKYDENVH
jgi:hypothetical protein